MTLILASASPIRRSLLEAAGVAVRVDPAAVDEAAIKAAHRGDDLALARALAEAKALARAAPPSADWVIGGDSVVSVDGRRFSKPASREEAAAHLRHFSGRTMILTSGVALARTGAIDWSHADSARLQVRALTERFIHNYLETEWPAVSGCVGVFRMEGPGAQLFDAVDGSHFTVLGLPLIPLLDRLRHRGLLKS